MNRNDIDGSDNYLAAVTLSDHSGSSGRDTGGRRRTDEPGGAEGPQAFEAPEAGSPEPELFDAQARVDRNDIDGSDNYLTATTGVSSYRGGDGTDGAETGDGPEAGLNGFEDSAYASVSGNNIDGSGNMLVAETSASYRGRRDTSDGFEGVDTIEEDDEQGDSGPTALDG